MSLDDAFANFEIDEPEQKVNKWCLPEEYQASIHDDGWFFKDGAEKFTSDPRELDYFRAMYYLRNRDYPAAFEAIQEWRKNCHHKGFFLVQVIDSLLRVALKDPDTSKELIDALFTEFQSIVTIPGDQLQLWDSEMKICLRFSTSSQRFLQCSILLVTVSPFLPDLWLNFTKWREAIGPNLHACALTRAILLTKYQLEQGMGQGFAKKKLECDIIKWSTQLELLPEEQRQRAAEEMALSRDRQFLAKQEEADHSAKAPAHDCRNKSAVFFTDQMCVEAVESFSQRYSWMLMGCVL
ncbi:unnamed protein product, partial [Mesorhabditis belari]|uniref:Uncharacterized protein n=1 Tax=Mesorhabditis belari TaxID=2138241 RepID=A0AAF3ELH7_9BILA